MRNAKIIAGAIGLLVVGLGVQSLRENYKSPESNVTYVNTEPSESPRVNVPTALPTKLAIKPISRESIVETLAGTLISPGEDVTDGTGKVATFAAVDDIAIDSSGTIYAVDGVSHTVRTVSQTGEVTTLAGHVYGDADGVGPSAQFRCPREVAVGDDGYVYVAEYYNHQLRKIAPDGTVTTIKSYNPKGEVFPFDVEVDGVSRLYVLEMETSRIVIVEPDGRTRILAGGAKGYRDGKGTKARFNEPYGICLDERGNLFVADGSNHKIRKVTPDGIVSTVAGSTEGFRDGSARQAQFDFPNDLATDKFGNLFVADGLNNRIRKISLKDGSVSTIIGNDSGLEDGLAKDAKLSKPSGLAFDSDGRLYIGDEDNGCIRVVTP